ncbi:MAG TPA: hypothetical protein VEG43_01820 [Dehalococcoidia bacterium]|nr:hypothetical protein [Dehalococcoidia bacterium]
MTIGPGASKPTMAVFSAGIVLTTVVLITVAGNRSTLTVDFNLGCSVITGLLLG